MNQNHTRCLERREHHARVLNAEIKKLVDACREALAEVEQGGANEHLTRASVILHNAIHRVPAPSVAVPEKAKEQP